MENTFRISPLSSTTWNDFVSLMQADPQCSECWCLNHREPTGCATGSEARKKMNELVGKSSVHGLLAYNEKNPVGWIAVDPMSRLVGHDCQTSGKADEWSIHCLYVKDGFRGKGISVQLIKSAIEYAKANGAKVISAFPIPHENRNKFPPNEAEFSGRFSTYSRLGFKVDGESADFYQRVEFRI